MSDYMHLAAYLAAMGIANLESKPVYRYEKPVKKCLNTGCGKEHTHNNSYCSAECCKEHRASKRSGS